MRYHIYIKKNLLLLSYYYLTINFFFQKSNFVRSLIKLLGKVIQMMFMISQNE